MPRPQLKIYFQKSFHRKIHFFSVVPIYSNAGERRSISGLRIFRQLFYDHSCKYLLLKPKKKFSTQPKTHTLRTLPFFLLNTFTIMIIIITAIANPLMEIPFIKKKKNKKSPGWLYWTYVGNVYVHNNNGSRRFRQHN